MSSLDEFTRRLARFSGGGRAAYNHGIVEPQERSMFMAGWEAHREFVGYASVRFKIRLTLLVIFVLILAAPFLVDLLAQWIVLWRVHTAELSAVWRG